MSDFNILFTSSGRRVSLIKQFRQSLVELKITGKIITADIKNNAPTAFISDYHIISPKVIDSSYVDFLIEAVQKYNIKLIIPLIDTELEVLASLKDVFKELGVIILVSDIELIKIAYDKRKTYDFFVKNGIKTPAIYQLASIMEKRDIALPLVIKPANGSGSNGLTIINDYAELMFFADYIKGSIIQEYITGKEYTVDILLDLAGNIVSIVPRLRIETRAGEVSKGMTVKNELIIKKVKEVVEKLPKGIGCITIQCFLTEVNEVIFIEINPRFGGGIPLSIKAGANFPLWILQMLIGEKPKIEIDEWAEGVVMLRYDSEIFINRDSLEAPINLVYYDE